MYSTQVLASTLQIVLNYDDDSKKSVVRVTSRVSTQQHQSSETGQRVPLPPDGHIVSAPLATLLDKLRRRHALAPHSHVAVAPLGSDRLAGSPVQPRRVVLLAP